MSEIHSAALAAAPVGILIYRDGNILYANPACADVMGRAGQESASLTPEDFLRNVHPKDRATLERDMFCNNPQIGGELVARCRITAAPGESRWLEARIQPIIYGTSNASMATFNVNAGERPAEKGRGQNQYRSPCFSVNP